MKYIIALNKVNLKDIKKVGGKNASTGEMIQNLSTKGIKVPNGFATTTDAYQDFISYNHLDKKIIALQKSLKINNISSLNKTSKTIRRWILTAPFHQEFINEITIAYKNMPDKTVAVRSSATAEDLATASFAGTQETFLNVKGINKLLLSIKHVYASLFNSRAIAYRYNQGISINNAAISVGIQPMIRSDKGVSGIIFTIDTESGFNDAIIISASYGLGEAIVQGQVNPDEFIISKSLLNNNKLAILQKRLGDKKTKMVYSNSNNPDNFIKTVPVSHEQQNKFCLTDQDITILAKQALKIEEYYKKPMDIEWAKDGITGNIIILQARPETVKSQLKKQQSIEQYKLLKKGEILVEGQSVGHKIASGKAHIITNINKMKTLSPGDILVTDMTDPDWEPIMKIASAIVTNRGGRTCHAAIVARELGIPAIVGCINATNKIKEKQVITVSCAEGQNGFIYNGAIPFTIKKTTTNKMPHLPLNLCLNIANYENAFNYHFLPNNGVGLARLEFIINKIAIHPNALIKLNELPQIIKNKIIKKISGYSTPKEFYIEKLREGISTIAASFYPKEVIFRFSDFKSNEYANLLGGHLFEPHEENPMLGFRGASRYCDNRFKEAFKLECEAIKRVRNLMGLDNAHVMIPFVRTVNELKNVIKTIENYGLKRRPGKLKIYMMCEIPSNILLAKEFLDHVDGYSIGSNDLTQLTLGLDRDSNLVANLFNEQDESIKKLLTEVITECKKQNKYIGICGQAPSDYPDFAVWLMQQGIDSISLNPDSITQTWMTLAKAIKRMNT